MAVIVQQACCKPGPCKRPGFSSVALSQHQRNRARGDGEPCWVVFWI